MTNNKKKKHSPKHRKDKKSGKEQPSVKEFLATTKDNQPRTEIKKRTPPSPTLLSPKKINMHTDPGTPSDEPCKVIDETQMETNSTYEDEETTSDSDSDSSASESYGNNSDNTNTDLVKKLTRMEKRITRLITASIERMIAKSLQPLKEDMRKLSAVSRQRDDKMDNLVQVCKENAKLQTRLQHMEKQNQMLNKKPMGFMQSCCDLIIYLIYSL